MEKNGASEKTSGSKSGNITTRKILQTTEDETLKVRLNKDHILLVNKEKLIKKSYYFKLATKSCFVDHKSEFTEVTIPVSFECFKKVIHYVNTDIIDISNNNVFQIFQISDYLQIECLSKMCLDDFIYNLNIKTLDDQMNLMEKYPLVCNDFKKVALKFKESGRPSVKGLYLSELHNSTHGKLNLQLFTEDGPEYVVNFENRCSIGLLHYFCNSIILDDYKFQFDLNLKNLIQYDLITGNLVRTEVQYEVLVSSIFLTIKTCM